MPYRVGRCLLGLRLAEAGMTPVQLAEKVGMKLPQISAYINNKRVMSLQNALSIASAVGCRVEDLYELEYVSPRTKQEP